MGIDNPDNQNVRKKQITRRNFGLGFTAAGGMGKILWDQVKNEEEHQGALQFSAEEQPSKLTHFGKGVRTALETNKGRISFDADNGALTVRGPRGALYSNEKTAFKRPLPRKISVTMGAENHSLIFMFETSNGGEQVTIENIYGDQLKVSTEGWEYSKEKK